MPTNIEWTDLTDNIIRAKEGGWWCQSNSQFAIRNYSPTPKGEGLNINTM
ncbi:hypothetical protein [Dendronalium sp. ChiSLP03b]|nr:hypothetical protein [Dendronalium sp. ChiSLP03b]MDZ8206772.1 hypothetical protein [Dendronalium sp. ChiSLP03b]